MINNAGVAPVQPLEDLDMAEFDRVHAVNVRGLVDVTRQALPLLKESRGSVINLSTSMVDNPMGTMSVYSSSKAAVNHLSQAWAKGLARHGVRLNYMSVGPIESPIYDMTDQTEGERQAHIKAVTPTSRSAASAPPTKSPRSFGSSYPSRPATSPAPTTPSTEASGSEGQVRSSRNPTTTRGTFRLPPEPAHAPCRYAAQRKRPRL